MSITTVISQLRSIANKADLFDPKLDEKYPDETQWEELGKLSERLVTAACRIRKNIREYRVSRAKRAWNDSKPLRSHADTCRKALLKKHPLRLSPIFRRNIVTIFEGPKKSNFDSEEVRARKSTTSQRCGQIRLLSPSGIISWAISFAPTTWSANSMAAEIFACLLHDIEPDSHSLWPPIVRETLHMLQEDEMGLKRSTAYQEFLRGNVAGFTTLYFIGRKLIHSPAYDSPASQSIYNPRKRQYIEGHTQETKTDQEDPSNYNREVKHMYTNADPDCIYKLPESFQKAVKQSQLWKWERSKGMRTTGCLSTFFPKDNTQDVSLTIWFGNLEAYDIIDEFELELVQTEVSEIMFEKRRAAITMEQPLAT